MKKYYVTCTTISKSNNVSCNLVDIVEAEKKPKAISFFTGEYDVYFDYFGSEKAAQKFIKNILKP